MKMIRGAVAIIAAAGLVACGGEDLVDQPVDNTENAPEAYGTTTASLSGVVLDWNDQPVANAEVQLVIAGDTVTDRILTDDQGRYTLPGVPVEAVQQARAENKEVTLLFYSPRQDLVPFGTEEGDRVHLLPVTLREFIDMDDLQTDADVWLRTAYVPLKQRGFKITDELIEQGGELTWAVPNSPVGELEISLVVEPGSILVDGDEPEDEITLTVLDAERAPMQIPNEGVGVLWTIQPRDIRFDPPAKIKIKGQRLDILGLTEVEKGSPFEINGATLEQGWKRYGDVEIAEVTDMTVTLQSTKGIIHRGAWGHVLSNPVSDAGMLVTCMVAGVPGPCAILTNQTFEGTLFDGLFTTNVSDTQTDFPGVAPRAFWYTDKETRCGGCTRGLGGFGLSRAEQAGAQMATGLTLSGDDTANQVQQVSVHTVALCPNEIGLDMATRDALVKARILLALAEAEGGLIAGEGDEGYVDPGANEGTTDRTMAWEEYCSDEGDCPEAADLSLQRRQFSRAFTFEHAAPNCL